MMANSDLMMETKEGNSKYSIIQQTKSKKIFSEFCNWIFDSSVKSNIFRLTKWVRVISLCHLKMLLWFKIKTGSEEREESIVYCGSGELNW